MARPTLLSDELRERMEHELADGIPVAVVAQKAHVSRTTLFEWIAKGYVVRKRKRDPLELVHESPPESVTPESLDARLVEAEPGLVAEIVRAPDRITARPRRGSSRATRTSSRHEKNRRSARQLASRGLAPGAAANAPR